jgi:hypothetical protein
VREIWAVRIRLQLPERLRDVALFNLAIDSKLRGCDLVAHGGTVAHRASVVQHETQQPVQFALTDQTRESVAAWIAHAKLRPDGFLFPSRVHQLPHPTTRQYARLVNRWVAMVGLGACQGSCRLIHAASGWLSVALDVVVTTESRSGLRVTAPTGDQLRVLPDQRPGLPWRAET